ncbi:hypothetical protein PGTUg99_010114 [Puccinia graminis f. sp. tritici]|uniref:Uncharacterized protein n=1 Tax=Puccinia graminis f. sp. tritici TaxID=56615 RepID=A0A5B0PAM3_PUCGR|nr:hypothetical protein PGTUg99_010114 [Puccinia graminis f. sp. tritici]
MQDVSIAAIEPKAQAPARASEHPAPKTKLFERFQRSSFCSEDHQDPKRLLLAPV